MSDKVWKITDSSGDRAKDSKIYTTLFGARAGQRSYVNNKLKLEYIYDDDLDYGAYCVYCTSKGKDKDWAAYMNSAVPVKQSALDAIHVRWEELDAEFTVQEATIS